MFLSAVFEKLARTHTPIFTNSCLVHFVYAQFRPTKMTNLAPRIGSLDSPDNADDPHICFIGRFGSLDGQFLVCMSPLLVSDEIRRVP